MPEPSTTSPLLTPLCTLGGALIGMGGIIVNNWLQNKNKGRESLDAWLERYIVTEGIEPVLFLVQRLALHEMARLGLDDVGEIPHLPTSAVQRVIFVLGTDFIISFLRISRISVIHTKSPEAMKEMDSAMFQFSVALQDLQIFVLNSKIQRKSDIFRFRNLQEIKALNQRMYAIHEAMLNAAANPDVVKITQEGIASAYDVPIKQIINLPEAETQS